MDGNLRTIVGVDEAGYGPRLGPLVIGLAAFRAPAAVGNLRDALAVAAPGGAVPVDDSKVLYRGGAGLPRLERSVLAFRGFAAEPLAPDPPGDSPPWGPSFPVPLPAFCAPGEVAAAADELSPALRAAGVTVLAVRTRTVTVAEFNRAVALCGNKAEVLFAVVADLLEPWLRGPGEVSLHVDRHGGRAYYSRLLSARFPDLCHFAAREGAGVSVYVFPRSGGPATISFEVEADGRYLETALASMAAKWVREIHMAALNRYFCVRAPDLRPTAGYAADAVRWLADTATLRGRWGVGEREIRRER